MSLTCDTWFCSADHRYFGNYDHGMLCSSDEDKALCFDDIVCGNDFWHPQLGFMKLVLDLDNLKLKEEKNFPETFVKSYNSCIHCSSFDLYKNYPAEHSYTEYNLSIDINSISCDGNELKFNIVSKGMLWGENRDKCSISKGKRISMITH